MSEKNNSILKVSNIILFLLTVSSKAVFEITEKLGLSLNDNIKYFLIVFVGIIYAAEYRFSGKPNKNIFKKELINIIKVVVFFALMTFYYSKKNNMVWDRRYSLELLYLLLPALFAFFSLKVISFNDFEKIVKIYFWIFCILYIVEKGVMVFLDFNISMIDISKSYSPLESNIICIPATFLFIYFTYYKYENYRYYIGSILLILLTFKRPLIIAMLFVVIIENIFELRVQLHKKWTLLISIFFFGCTIIYTMILSGIGNISSEVLNTFTSNRYWLLSLVLMYDTIKKGYGSTTVLLGDLLGVSGGRYLEMDLVKILVEVGLIGLFVLCFVYFKICKNNALLLLLMSSIFVNLLTSHSFTDPFVWSCYFVFFGMVTYNVDESNKYLASKRHLVRRLHVKFKF